MTDTTITDYQPCIRICACDTRRRPRMRWISGTRKWFASLRTYDHHATDTLLIRLVFLTFPAMLTSIKAPTYMLAGFQSFKERFREVGAIRRQRITFSDVRAISRPWYCKQCAVTSKILSMQVPFLWFRFCEAKKRKRLCTFSAKSCCMGDLLCLLFRWKKVRSGSSKFSTFVGR